jgi:hypothetical protein
MKMLEVESKIIEKKRRDPVFLGRSVSVVDLWSPFRSIIGDLKKKDIEKKEEFPLELTDAENSLQFYECLESFRWRCNNFI